MIPIDIHSKAGCADKRVHQFAEHRVAAALDHMRSVRRIGISIEDVNGPKGGTDKLCRIVAEFPFGLLVIEEVQPDWQGAVAHSIRRLAQNATQRSQNMRRSYSKSRRLSRIITEL